jgi:hypothetical protein
MATVTFDPDTHCYTVDGITIPSVTQRIKAAGLLGPAVSCYSPESAARGIAAHLACADRDQGRDVTTWLAGEFGGYLASYTHWCDVMLPTWTAIESPQYSSRYRTAGTPDRVGTISGRPVVLDLKTGRQAHWHGIQVALYCLLQDDDIPPRERRRLVLYLRKDGRMAQSVEFTSPSDFTTALTLCATQETTDASDHPHTPRTGPASDHGPAPATGTGTANARPRRTR